MPSIARLFQEMLEIATSRTGLVAVGVYEVALCDQFARLAFPGEPSAAGSPRMSSTRPNVPVADAPAGWTPRERATRERATRERPRGRGTVPRLRWIAGVAIPARAIRCATTGSRPDRGAAGRIANEDPANRRDIDHGGVPRSGHPATETTVDGAGMAECAATRLHCRATVRRAGPGSERRSAQMSASNRRALGSSAVAGAARLPGGSAASGFPSADHTGTLPIVATASPGCRDGPGTGGTPRWRYGPSWNPAGPAG
jgi:hypothetical protein